MRRPHGGEGRGALAAWSAGQACSGNDGHRGRSRALRPASARGLKYYPGIFNYLFLMDL